MRRTGRERIIVPVTVTGVFCARKRSAVCGAGRGCISAAKPPMSNHVAARGSRAMRILARRARAARRACRMAARRNQTGSIQKRLAMRIPAANASAAKSRGARVKQMGSCSMAPMERFATPVLRWSWLVVGGATVVAMNPGALCAVLPGFQTRSRVATVSRWNVCGNRSIRVRATGRYPDGCSVRRSRARVAGSQET